MAADTVATLPPDADAEHLAALGLVAVTAAEGPAVLPRMGKDGYVRAESTGARTFADSVAVLRRGGHLCLVGALTGDALTLSAWDLIQELRLTGWSSENLTGPALREHIAQIAEHVRRGSVALPAIHRFSMPAAADAHRRLEQGGLPGRTLLVPPQQ